MEISTPRLQMRPLGPSDLDAVLGLWNDRDVRRYLWDDRVVTRREVAEALDASEADFSSRRFGLWGLYESGDPRLVVALGDGPVAESGSPAARSAAATVRWPDGTRERFPLPEEGGAVRLRRGFGTLE